MRIHRPTPIHLIVWATWGAVALTGLELGLRLAFDIAGAWGVIAASIAFPATIAAAPLLALTWGQWIPALVVYGGGFSAAWLLARRDPADDERRRRVTS